MQNPKRKTQLNATLRILAFTWILFGSRAWAQGGAATSPAGTEAHREFRVRYVTADAIYFNGGTALGVRPGDKVWLLRNGKKTVQLEVKYVSAHSASCLLEKEDLATEGQNVRVDDVLRWEIPMPEFLKRTRPAAEPVRKAVSLPAKNTTPFSAPPKRVVARSRSSNNAINGQISLQSFGQKDRGPQQFDFFESSAYLRLNLENAGGLPLRLLTRMRGSRNYREIGTAGMQTSRNRVHELALEYDAPGAPFAFAVGRMLRHELRGVGYLDGMALSYRPNTAWQAGVFYGAQPDLYDYGVRLNDKKFGGFVQTRLPIATASQLSVSLIGVGQYTGSQINREYLATATDFNLSRQLYLTHCIEIDLNRGWRRAAGESALTLSNTYFNTSYFASSAFSFGVSYDARRLLRTWETRTIVDSLFDQNLRQGWRANFAWQPTSVTRFALDGGWQGQKNSPDVYSAGVSAYASNFFTLNVSARFSYFGNSISSGYYPSVDFARSFFSMIYVTAGGGAYIYHNATGGDSQSPWERLRLDCNLARRFYLSTTIENFHGGTMRFWRGFADLGWRF